MPVGEMDSFLSRNKSLCHPWTKDTLRLGLWAVQLLETTDQLEINIQIWELFNSNSSKTQSFIICHELLKTCRNLSNVAKSRFNFTVLLKSTSLSLKHSSYITLLTCIHPTSTCQTLLPQGQTCFYFWNAQSSERRHECVMDVYSMPRTYPKDINSSLWGRVGIEEAMQTARDMVSGGGRWQAENDGGRGVIEQQDKRRVK